MEHKVLLTAEEASKQIFGGKRSAWSLLQDAKNKRLPAIHIGNRVFFEVNSINVYIDKQLQKSLTTDTIEVDGIRKID